MAIEDILRQLGMHIPLMGPDMGAIPDMPTIPNDDTFDPAARMAQLYHPETGASEHLNRLLNSFPVRNQPTTLRRIGSMLAGLSDVGHPERAEQSDSMSQRMLYEPFLQQLSDWKMQIDPAVSAANAERGTNANQRAVASSIISNEQADRRLERQINRDKTIERQGDTRLKQADQRIAQGDERLKVAKAVARGGLFKMDPSTGQGKMVFKDGSSIDVDIHQLPEENLLELKQKYAMERIDENATTRQENRPSRTRTEVIQDPDDPTGQKRILVIVDPDTGTVRPANYERPKVAPQKVTPTTRTSETEKSKFIDARALRIKNSNPRMARYIKMKNGKLIEIQKPNTFFPGGISAEEFDALSKEIYGGEAPAASQVVSSNGNKPTTRADGKTHVRRKADGQTGWVTNPDSKLYDVIP